MTLGTCLPAPWREGFHLPAGLQARACNLVVKEKACSPRKPNQAARHSSRSPALLRQCQVGFQPQNPPPHLHQVPSTTVEGRGMAKPLSLQACPVTSDNPLSACTAAMRYHSAGIGGGCRAILYHSQRKNKGKFSTTATLSTSLLIMSYSRSFSSTNINSESGISSLTRIKLIPK